MTLTLSMFMLVIDDNLHNGAWSLLGIHKSSPVTSGPKKAGKTCSLLAWQRIIVRVVIRMSLKWQRQIQLPKSTSENEEMALHTLEGI